MIPVKMLRTRRSERLPVLLMLSLALLALCSCSEPDSGPKPPLVVIGIDGAEWSVIERMISEGELPNFARIRSEGSWGYLLNPGPAISPIVWTTFATGRFPREHGILAHVYPYTDGGEKRPVSSELRQTPALWNIASHYGLRSNVIGYFVSHPPESINGVMVSPRAMSTGENAITPVDGIDLSRPPFRELEKEAVRAEVLSRYFGWPFEREQAKDPDSPYHEAARIVTDRNIDRRILADEFLHRAAMQLVDTPADLFITYYRVVDYMSHSLWVFYDDSEFETKPDARQQAWFGEALRESYRFVDRAVGDLIEAWDGQANILIISDHGFAAANARKRAGPTNIAHLTGDHLPNGVVMGIGPDFVPGEIRDMTIMDVAPTVAAMLDLPLSGELPGDVALDLLRPGFLDEHPIQPVADYASVRVLRESVDVDVAAEQEDMKTLRGLGYIGEGVDLTDTASSGEYDFWASSAEILSHNLMTEVVFYLLRGDADSARQRITEVEERRPDALDLTRARVAGKYLRMKEQLPEAYLDDAVFNAFFGEDARRYRRRAVSDDA